MTERLDAPPTIRDLRDAMSEMVDGGFGDLPVQIVIVPDSTLQAIGKTREREKPALMIDLVVADSPRLPVSLISMRAVGGRLDAMPSVREQ